MSRDRGHATERGALLAGWLGLVGLIVLTYWPVGRNGFVWDDWANVVGARSYRTLDAAGLRWMFTSTLAGHYQPLAWLSFAIDDRLWGGGAAGYHWTNVALHAVNAGLVIAIAARLHALATAGVVCVRERAVAALLAGAVFALHPLRVESVAWATERRDLLSAFFFLVVVRLHLAMQARPRRGPERRRWLAVSCAGFLLCLLANAQVALPLVLLILDFHPLRRVLGADGRVDAAAVRAALTEKAPLGALALAFAAGALRAQASAGALVAVGDHGVAARLAQAGYGLVFYLRAWALAVAWYPLYERPWRLDPGEPRFLLAAAIVVLLTLVLTTARRRAPWALAAWLAHVALLLPVLGLFQSGVQLVADRYSYLAGIGWAVLAGAAAARLSGATRTPARRALAAAVVLALLAAWTALARRQVEVWRDDTSLWRHVLRGGPSAVAHNNLGILLVERGETRAGTRHLARSLAIVPTYHRPWRPLAWALEHDPTALDAGTLTRLTRILARALRHHPDSATAHYTLGLAFAAEGRDADALARFDDALRQRPDHQGAQMQRRQAAARLAREPALTPPPAPTAVVPTPRAPP